MCQRWRVRIPPLYSGWTFFTYLFVVKFVTCAWKDENKLKRGRGWPFLDRWQIGRAVNGADLKVWVRIPAVEKFLRHSLTYGLVRTSISSYVWIPHLFWSETPFVWLSRSGGGVGGGVGQMVCQHDVVFYSDDIILNLAEVNNFYFVKIAC